MPFPSRQTQGNEFGETANDNVGTTIRNKNNPANKNAIAKYFASRKKDGSSKADVNREKANYSAYKGPVVQKVGKDPQNIYSYRRNQDSAERE